MPSTRSTYGNREYVQSVGPGSTNSTHHLKQNAGECGASSGCANHHDDEYPYHSTRFHVCSLQMNQTQPLTSSVLASISISSES